MYLTIHRPLFNIWLLLVLQFTLLATQSFASSTFICNQPLICNTLFSQRTCALTSISSPCLYHTGQANFSVPTNPTTIMSSTVPTTLNLDSTPKLSVSLIHEPRIHLEAWLKAILKYARKLHPTLDAYGSLYLVCPDDKWNMMSKNIITHSVTGVDPGDGSHGPWPPTVTTTHRARPAYVKPPEATNSDNTATRAFFTVATDAFNKQLDAEAKLVDILLTSIGESNEEVLEKSGTDMLDITAMQIVQGMISECGDLRSADLELKRAPLHTKLASMKDFTAHANKTRILLKNLDTAGFAYVAIDNYNNFINTLSNFNLKDYIKTYTIAHPKLADKSFETFVAFLDDHIDDINADAASANPFVGAAEAAHNKKLAVFEKKIAAQDKKINQLNCLLLLHLHLL